MSVHLPASHRAMKWTGPATALLTAMTLMQPAQAQVERLDDSTSPRARVQAHIEPQPDAASRQDPSAASPFATVLFPGVEYRLATARFAGRSARIFYVVPAAIPGLRSPSGMQVEWRSSGPFASGKASPGERRLVWSGIVPGPWMTERFDLRVQLDLRAMRHLSSRSIAFESYFEIEPSP